MIPLRKDSMMAWVRGVVGGILVLLGLIWIGQGLNILHGSGMSGQGIFAILGLVAAIVGLWLIWGLTTVRSQVGQ